MKRLLFALAVTLLISACTNKVGYLSIVVPEGQSFNASTLSQATVRKNAAGSDWRPIILFFPLGYPKLDTAVQEALTNNRGDVLTNASIIETMRWWVLFGYTKLEVQGDAVSISQVAKMQRRGN